MTIQLAQGVHITATEKKHIAKLIENEIGQGGTKVKQYKLDYLGNDFYRVDIASKYTATIGDDANWHKNTIIIKVKENKNGKQHNK